MGVICNAIIQLSCNCIKYRSRHRRDGRSRQFIIPFNRSKLFFCVIHHSITYNVCAFSLSAHGFIIKKRVVMLVYFIVPFLYKKDLSAILRATFIPSFKQSKSFLMVIVGILGTTISPCLFFQQVSVEVEEIKSRKKHLIVHKKIIHDMKNDVDFGMAISGLVMYFIILTTGSVFISFGDNANRYS